MEKYCFLIPVLILWCSATHVTGLLNLQHNTEQQRVTDCVLTLLQQLTKKDYITIMDADQILDLATLHSLQTSAFILQTMSWNNSLLYTNTYVIASKTYEHLAGGLNSTKYSFLWNPTAHFVIFVEHLDDPKNISRLLLDYNILSVAVVTKNEYDYDIYTYRTNFNACNKSEVLVVANKCHLFDGRNMFPDLKNVSLRGCQFKLIVQTRWPLINFQKPEGIETYATKMFEKHTGLKFDIILQDPDKRLPFPRIPEGIRNNSAEMVIGGYIVLPQDASKYSFSYPVLLDSFVITVRHRDFLSTWQATFGMNLGLISIIFVTFIVYCLISVRSSLFPKREKDIARDVIIVLGYFLNKITVRNIRSDPAHQLVFMSMLFFILIMPYIFQGYFYSVITHPLRGVEVKDAQEIMRNFIVLLPHGWNALNISGRNCSHILNCLLEVKNNNHEKVFTVVTTEQLVAFGLSLLDEQCQNMLYTLKLPYGVILRTFYFRRGSILHKPFDKFILHLTATGLLQKTFGDFLYLEKFKCKPKYVPNRVPQSMWDFKEAFIILLIGYIISIIIFIFERRLKK